MRQLFRLLLISGAVALATSAARAGETPATAMTAPAQTAAASAPAQTTPAFHTHFESGDGMGSYFTALAMRFGVAVVQPDSNKPAFILKSFDLPNKLDDAVALGQAALAPQGLTLRQSVAGTMIVLRVVTIEDARQAELQESPVSSGIELEKIDISRPDRVVTHLLPVSHPETAAALQRIAAQTKDVKADIAGSAETGITLILTGPAKGVQDAAASIIKVDKPDSSKVVAKTMQLHNLSAEEMAISLNATFARQEGSLKAVADRRTNSIVITGPEDKVLDAMVGVIGMEASRGRVVPAAETPPDSQPATQPGQ